MHKPIVVVESGTRKAVVPSSEQMKATAPKEWCTIHANYYYTDCTICILKGIWLCLSDPPDWLIHNRQDCITDEKVV